MKSYYCQQNTECALEFDNYGWLRGGLNELKGYTILNVNNLEITF